MSCNVYSSLVLLCCFLSCGIMPCLILSCSVLSCSICFCPFMSCAKMSYIFVSLILDQELASLHWRHSINAPLCITMKQFTMKHKTVVYRTKCIKKKKHRNLHFFMEHIQLQLFCNPLLQPTMVRWHCVCHIHLHCAHNLLSHLPEDENDKQATVT